jgi:mitogen-activated protein kinase kinase 9
VLKIAAGATHVIDFYALLREPGGKAALVLEYMDAGSLGSLLRRRRRGGLRIPEAAVAEVAFQCVRGLLQLHYNGVAHLDVKPDNILANSRGEIKMSEFNLSRVLRGPSGEPLQVPITGGTKMYYSPERFAPKACAGPIGAMKADVWGIGVTILELFLGRLSLVPGVEKPSAEELKKAIFYGEPPSVPEDEEASAELRAFLAACLQKKPAQRAMAVQLLAQPFIARRDVEASKRALLEILAAA